MLTCGLVGLPGSGKSTLFALLAGPGGAPPPGRAGVARRVVAVPDPRLDLLAADFAPRKPVHTQLEVLDVPGLVPGERARTLHFLEAVRGADALIFVLRGFASGPETANPAGELDTLEAELILTDLAVVERNIERLEGRRTGSVRRQDAPLHAVLCRVRDRLADGAPYREVALREEERALLAHFDFLSGKPAVWVLNVAEDQLETAAERSDLAALADRRGVPLVTVSAQVEKEIAELPEDDAALFMADLGLDEPGSARVIRAVHRRLGLISFFTVGDREVRAWTIRAGTRAREAAGKVHSDMERGFIRAEVLAFADYARVRTDAGGGDRAMAAARDKGLVRLEGADYRVEDGDIIHYRFNV